MGLFDVYRCPNIECTWNKSTGKKDEHCPECGTPLKPMGINESGDIITAKKALLKERSKDPETKMKEEQERLNRLLFHSGSPDGDLIHSIESDMNNLAMHEAGTAWMRAGTLLSLNSRDQMVGAGFKALMDQNKILIKQNELILRQLLKSNEK